jgi:hypothetical protein
MQSRQLPLTLTHPKGKGPVVKTMPELPEVDTMCRCMSPAVVCEICSDACKNLESQGYQDIEYHDSDDYLADLLKANDQYLFDEAGDFVE